MIRTFVTAMAFSLIFSSAALTLPNGGRNGPPPHGTGTSPHGTGTTPQGVNSKAKYCHSIAAYCAHNTHPYSYPAFVACFHAHGCG
jgi:hypothetical protein